MYRLLEKLHLDRYLSSTLILILDLVMSTGLRCVRCCWSTCSWAYPRQRSVSAHCGCRARCSIRSRSSMLCGRTAR